MSRNHTIPKGRVLPPSYKFLITENFFRYFTWKERLQILIGYRALIKLQMCVEHSPGKHQSSLELETSKELTPPDPTQ